jgi:hypothetical protein
MSRRSSSWCCCSPYTIACELSRSKQAHGQRTDDYPSGVLRTSLSCSIDVRCNRGFKHLQIHSENSAIVSPHTPHQTGYADKLVLPPADKHIVRRHLNGMQSSNGLYAFSASFIKLGPVFIILFHSLRENPEAAFGREYLIGDRSWNTQFYLRPGS